MRFWRSLEQPSPSFSQVQMGENLMTIEQRIEALEKRCKRLGKTLMGVGTLALFAVVAGTVGWTVAYTGAISPTSITTKTIVLKDSAGKTRIGLFGRTGSVHAFDSAGKTRVGIFGKTGSVRAYDRAGKMRVWLDGSGGRIRAYDRAGKWRVGLYGGNGSIYLYDSAGKTRVVLIGSYGKVFALDSAERMRVQLDGASGKIRFTAPDGTFISHP